MRHLEQFVLLPLVFVSEFVGKENTMADEIRFRRPIEEAGYSILYHALTLDRELSDQAFRLYSLLLKYAQQKDYAYPGIERLAEDPGKGEKSIRRAMNELMQRGLISRQRRFGTSSITWIEDPNDVYGDALERACEAVKNDRTDGHVVPKVTFDTWLKDTRLLSCQDGVFIIGVQNEFDRGWPENRLLSTVKRTLAGIVGKPVEVKFVVEA